MRDEAYVKSQICKYLDSIPDLEWFRRNAGGLNYKKGIPDLYCVYEGIHYEIEVKDPSGMTSVMQDKWRVRLERAGAIYILADSLEDVKNIIKENNENGEGINQPGC